MATPPQAGHGYGNHPTAPPQGPPFQQYATAGHHPPGSPTGGSAAGGSAAGGSAAVGASASGGDSGERRGDGRRALRRAAGWGFTGALLASVVWTAVVLTVPGMVSVPTAPQGLHGYHTVDDLCRAARLVRFTQLYPQPDATPSHHTDLDPALDSMSCILSLERNTGDSGDSGDTEYASLYAQVKLHKAVNAGLEFDAEKAGMQQQRYEITDVPGLGEEAYIAFRDGVSGSDGAWHSVSQELQIRDGGMTYYLSWSGSYQDGKSTAPDRETIRQSLLADSRDLLKELGGP
ncbi:hypothetical protein [Kitasatospora sp. NBC_00315]|uniref:hypothetical protein n=1 Tax=Kitasatospora sp. NBC_00315 TaxID=2975963 RepID=UPI003247FA5C